VTRLQVAAALALSLIFAAVAQAAGRSAGDGPQWPDVPDSALPAPNPHPSFVDPDETINRIMRPKPGDLDADASISADGPQWPNVPEDKMPAAKPAAEDKMPAPKPSTADARRSGAAEALAKATEVAPAEAAPPAAAPAARSASDSYAWYRPDALMSPFAFETGARYWFSSGRTSFAFTNGDPLFGSPTSTLDWHGLTANSGEVFARTGAFVKGLFGAGGVFSGQIDDRDFLAGQLKFSDTTSQVKSGNLTYAMLDIGWAFVPIRGVRLSFFAGYHYWRENETAFGIICNQTLIGNCAFPGAIPVDFNTAVLKYQPVWHAVRVGTEGKFNITDRWSFSSEIAVVPYAAQSNDDSHLLRTDLGPVPNVITTNHYAYGVEAEAFINYAVTPNIEVGAGARYWGLASEQGNVRFGPSFSTKDSLDHFEQERYGLLLQVKGRF
jgi:hypothetical protein